MIGRKFCIARRHSKRLLICGAPPQTAPRPVIGELENRNISVPMTFSPRACCIRHRLPDHAVKDGGVVTADAQPDIPGFPRPRPPRSGPLSFYGSGNENSTTKREPGASPASALLDPLVQDTEEARRLEPPGFTCSWSERNVIVKAVGGAAACLRGL